MKKCICSLLMFTLLFVMFVSCDPYAANKEKLKKLVEETQSLLPQDKGSLGVLSDITYVGDMVTLSYLVNEDLVNVDLFAEDSILFKENFQCFVSNDNDFRYMMNDISSANASLTMKYEGQTSGKIATLTITSKELNDDKFILNSNEAAEKIINNIFKIERKNLPKDQGDGVTMTDIFREGDTYVYFYTLDNRMYQSEAFTQAAENAMKRELLESYSDGSISKYVIDAFVTLQKNICYRYHIKGTADCFDVILTPEDLKSVSK